MCRHLRQLACAPELLEGIPAFFRLLRLLRAFLPWLTQHAAHVQRLRLSISPQVGPEGGTIAAQCAVACGVADHLQCLQLSCGVPLPPLDWLP